MAKEKTYSQKLKDPKWQKRRLEIMKRDKFKCRLCNDNETELQVHHKEYINGNNPWEYENALLITLCEHCHEEVTHLQKDGIEFNEIKAIHKSNNWSNGYRIMFISYKESCSMRIYDTNDRFIVGFNISDELNDIIKILRKSIPKWPSDSQIPISIKNLS